MAADSLQVALGEAGACPEVGWNGKIWKIGHPTQRAKAILEELAADRSISEVVAMKAYLSPAAYAELFAESRRAIAKREYATWGEGWQAVMSSIDGGLLFLLSLLRVNHPEATEETVRGLMADKGDEVAAAMDRVMPPFFALLVESLPAPPAERAKHLAGMLADFQRRRTPTV